MVILHRRQKKKINKTLSYLWTVQFVSKLLYNSIFFPDCSPGYTGIECTLQCPYPLFGKDCQKLCKCLETECSFVSGCLKSKNMLIINSKLPLYFVLVTLNTIN